MARTSARRGRQSCRSAQEEIIDEDDICQICQLLLLRPVRTTCQHIFCEACFSHWADVSINQMTMGLDIDEPVVLPLNQIEARCPMCRSATVAEVDAARVEELETRYPNSYETRVQEFSDTIEDEEGSIIEQLVVYIGNEHKMKRSESEDDRNVHEWRFFVRASRTDIIEEIQVFLHESFRQNQVVLQYPPYSIRRLGWGTFTILANVVLKAGYSWVSPEAENTSDGAVRGKLPLEWTLDFHGRGSMGRLRLKVKREKDVEDSEEEREAERTRRLWMRQRQRDPDYEPPVEV